MTLHEPARAGDEDTSSMLRSLAILMIVLASFPLIFMAPHVGVLVWTWFSYMFPNRMMYGFATYFPFLDIVAALTALGWLFSREPKNCRCTRSCCRSSCSCSGSTSPPSPHSTRTSPI
nr:DUF5935 domain-containing protein [Hankyongella ginsenosidimutans]